MSDLTDGTTDPKSVDDTTPVDVKSTEQKDTIRHGEGWSGSPVELRILEYVFPEDGSETNKAVLTNSLRLNPNFGALFTAREFLTMGLPIFARSSYIEVTRITSRPLTIRCHQRSIVQSTLASIVAKSKQTWVMAGAVPGKVDPTDFLRVLLNPSSLHSINIHGREVRAWLVHAQTGLAHFPQEVRLAILGEQLSIYTRSSTRKPQKRSVRKHLLKSIPS